MHIRMVVLHLQRSKVVWSLADFDRLGVAFDGCEQRQLIGTGTSAGLGHKLDRNVTGPLATLSMLGHHAKSFIIYYKNLNMIL